MKWIPIRRLGSNLCRTVPSLLYIIAWLASTALILADLATLRYLVLGIVTWIGVNWATSSHQKVLSAGHAFGWTIEVVDQAMLLIMACVGIGFAIILEYYYRRGLHKGLLIKRVVTAMAIQLAIAGAALALQTLI